jgi:hypothetical protein
MGYAIFRLCPPTTLRVADKSNALHFLPKVNEKQNKKTVFLRKI